MSFQSAVVLTTALLIVAASLAAASSVVKKATFVGANDDSIFIDHTSLSPICEFFDMRE